VSVHYQLFPDWAKAPATNLYFLIAEFGQLHRFVELAPWRVMALACFLQTTLGDITGISFIDSTTIAVCHPNRAKQHKVFKDQAGWGKSLVKWYFGSSCI